MKDSKDYRDTLEEMKNMTWKERFEHIWLYYKFRICMILFLCLIGIGVISAIRNISREVLISGLISNIQITEEGRDYLTDGYMAHLGGDKKNQRVDLGTADFDDIGSFLGTGFLGGTNEGASPSSIAMTLSGAGALDYLIMDEEAMKMYMGQEILMDLTEFFTEEELEAMSGKLVKLETVDEEDETVSVIPVAIIIDDMPFTKDCLSGAKNYFFAIGVTTPVVERCRDFWQYLQAWGVEG